MKSEAWTLNSGDGLRFFMQSWEPEHRPAGVVCLVHGLGEHSGRYSHMAARFTGAGYALIAFDLRGHGQSEGKRGHFPGFESMLQDIDLLLEQAAIRFAGVPAFLYGHSLGGILVLNYSLRRKQELMGVISSAAGLRTALEKQALKVTLAKVLGSVLPASTLSSGLDPKTISRDPAVVEAYTRDPLVHDQISFGMAKSLLEAICWAFDHAYEFSVPLLLMHGSDDQLGYKEGSQEFASRVKQDCTLKIWEGLSHELHNEPEKEDVFEFTIQWMEKLVKSGE